MSGLILVADDDPFNLRLLQEVCEAAGHRVISAADGGQVLDMVARERPDLVLLDVNMPILNGFEVLRVLKSDPNLQVIPVLLVTAAGEVDARSRGIEMGADDYVTKPYRVFEIQQRIRNALRIRRAESVARERDSIAPPSLVDPLTHAGTSQQLTITLDYEYTRAVRYHHPLACIAVRVMNFGDIVAAHGEQVGDGLLAQTAGGLRGCIRGIDHLFRSDLDEFMILLPETSADGINVVLSRIQRAASDGSLFGATITPQPIVATGCAAIPHRAIVTAEDLLRAAAARS